MRKLTALAMLVACMALAAAPAGASHKEGHVPGPKPGKATKAKAYGKYCQDQSKKHVAGQKGTPFSQCVTAMAKLAKDKVDNPRRACADLSKKRVAGEKGTPFSRCVSGGKELLEDLEETS